jgi:hypothetical protein
MIDAERFRSLPPLAGDEAIPLFLQAAQSIAPMTPEAVDLCCLVAVLLALAIEEPRRALDFIVFSIMGIAEDSGCAEETGLALLKEASDLVSLKS